MATAAPRVFAIPELTEMILCHVTDARDLFIILRTNAHFKGVINRSRCLCERMMLERAATNRDKYFNPLLVEGADPQQHALWPFTFQCRRREKDMVEDDAFTSSFGFRSHFGNDSAEGEDQVDIVWIRINNRVCQQQRTEIRQRLARRATWKNMSIVSTGERVGLTFERTAEEGVVVRYESTAVVERTMRELAA